MYFALALVASRDAVLQLLETQTPTAEEDDVRFFKHMLKWPVPEEIASLRDVIRTSLHLRIDLNPYRPEECLPQDDSDVEVNDEGPGIQSQKAAERQRQRKALLLSKARKAKVVT